MDIEVYVVLRCALPKIASEMIMRELAKYDRIPPMAKLSCVSMRYGEMECGEHFGLSYANIVAGNRILSAIDPLASKRAVAFSKSISIMGQSAKKDNRRQKKHKH